MIHHETPSQTIGPFHHVGLVHDGGDALVDPADDDAIVVHGTVTDGGGEPVTDALVELWQADTDGSYPRLGSSFTGFGRAATDDQGGYRFTTRKPGAVDGQAPHLNLTVFARGLLTGLRTRAYFADEGAANDADGVLAAVPPERRDTMLAPVDAGGYVFDIRLQGPQETVFLAF
jgi:protocatechuate 3,4-dioxygenase alpha subunit